MSAAILMPSLYVHSVDRRVRCAPITLARTAKLE
jgi:hypothetical protein